MGSFEDGNVIYCVFPWTCIRIPINDQMPFFVWEFTPERTFSSQFACLFLLLPHHVSFIFFLVKNGYKIDMSNVCCILGVCVPCLLWIVCHSHNELFNLLFLLLLAVFSCLLHVTTLIFLQFLQFQYTPQHLVRLLQIIVDGSCDMAVRQVASIHFKNFIAKNWSPNDPGMQRL